MVKSFVTTNHYLYLHLVLAHESPEYLFTRGIYLAYGELGLYSFLLSLNVSIICGIRCAP